MKLNERSRSPQGALNDVIDLNNLSMNAKFFHPKGEMAERSASMQESSTETAFSLLVWDPNEVPDIGEWSNCGDVWLERF